MEDLLALPPVEGLRLRLRFRFSLDTAEFGVCEPTALPLVRRYNVIQFYGRADFQFTHVLTSVIDASESQTANRAVNVRNLEHRDTRVPRLAGV